MGCLGGNKGVVVDGARDFAAAKAGANLETLGRGDGEHGVCEHGLQLVKARLAEPRGRILDDARHRAANAVGAVAERSNQLLHASRGGLVGTAHGQVGIDRLARDALQQGQERRVRRGRRVLGRRREEVFGADAAHKGDNLDAVCQLEVFFGDCARCDAADRLAGAAPAAAGRGLDAVLFEVGPVGVRRAGVQVHGGVAIVLGALVLVEDEHADGRAQGDAAFGSGLNLNTVFFVARGRDGGLAGAAAGHLRLDVGLGEGHARRAAVDYAADRAAVGLAIAKRKRRMSAWSRAGKSDVRRWEGVVRGDTEVLAKGRHGGLHAEETGR